jgi:DNA-binding PadR family transcriptional regulator
MSLKHSVLGLLYQQPMHGYEISKYLSLIHKGEGEVKPNQIATTLARLEQAQMVRYEVEEAQAAPDRKVYRLTDEGLKELANWYQEPETHEYWLGSAFYLKLVLSLNGSPVTPEQVLNTQRRWLYNELHEVIRLREQVDAEAELPLYLLLETVVVHLEADLRWIEMCDSRLADLKKYKLPTPQPLPRGRPRQSARSTVNPDNRDE